MKRKLIISIIFLIGFSVLFIPMSYGAKNDYTVQSIKFDKDKLEKSKSKEEVEEIVNQIKSVDTSKLSTGDVVRFNRVIETFAKGAYGNLSDNNFKSKCYKEIIKYEQGSVSYKLVEKAKSFAKPGNGTPGYGASQQDSNLPLIWGEDGSGAKTGIIYRRKNEKLANGKVSPPDSAAAGQSGEDKTSDYTKEKEEEIKENKKFIYQLPKKADNNRGAAQSLDDVMGDAEDFIKQGTINYEELELKNFSTTLYNILLTIGVAIAIITGSIIGIKYMTGSIEAKATYKQMLVPYLFGCAMVFGAFGIWKIVVIMLESI